MPEAWAKFQKNPGYMFSIVGLVFYYSMNFMVTLPVEIKRIKDFKILNFIPPYLRCYAEKPLKVCAGLVNSQNSLIKEVRGTVDTD